MSGPSPTGQPDLDNLRNVNAAINLSRLEFRRRGMVFIAMLLILIMPFQLLMIPLYVMIVDPSAGPAPTGGVDWDLRPAAQARPGSWTAG